MTPSLDPPAKLPVDRLSVSSLRLLAQCPERWRRRYLEREYEPSSGAAVLGKAIGGAENQHYGLIIEGEDGLSTDDVMDEYSSQFDEFVSNEEVNWGKDKPGELKDSGLVVLGRYHNEIAVNTVPTSVEREFDLRWPGLDWNFTGYLDLEEDDGAVSDLKVRSGTRGRISETEAASDLQPSAYLYARRAEGEPAPEFRYHAMVRTKSPYAEVVPTTRTDNQLDWFEERVFLAANEIAFRAEFDQWSGAVPGAWWCSQRFCGYWDSCKWGGLR